ncbi:transcription factor MYB59, putative [Entamoeba invadens IP1]|uniref:Transcription factor MYB59, putative n=1 Tax=Entamoeba invadens IP1 TaxID=370355 RepID=A0A0A1TVP4_ENTIV|nr:transcription factor MYB59, putative [Entamoeba invadens IP1]ELP84481.1 transcription factor MYB59, putative [Entamoeba invadens IP1]|eukprot:XP_004183827.1 transcription factor MYB59, putative [Entamoeba invadens IP1]
MSCEHNYTITESKTNSFENESRKKRKSPTSWSESEDFLLKQAVETFGDGHWVEVSQHVGTRSRKQCRERYINFVNPDINTAPWKQSEDKIIIDMYMRNGNKWTLMNKLLPGRTARAIRNRQRVLFFLKQNYKEIKDTPEKHLSGCFVCADKNSFVVMENENRWF